MRMTDIRKWQRDKIKARSNTRSTVQVATMAKEEKKQQKT
jgi:hypothetical protein